MKVSEVSSTAGNCPPISRASFAPPPPEGFRLRGPTPRLDPRVHAFRSDIADIKLAGQLFAPHYARAQDCRCAANAVMVRSRPSNEAPAVSQLLHGEGFAMLDRAGDWAWGRCLHDDYVGYVPAAALGPVDTPTHRVTAPLALIFVEASIKAAVTGTRAIGCQVSGSETGDFLRVEEGFIHLRHLSPIGEEAADPVAVAERLIGAPYLWGGRGADGVDCSGLVQVALGLCGIRAPRDSDQQRAELGRPLDDGEPLRRGDLVFFPGHVGFMADETHLLHANAFWMAVTLEPLADVIERLRPLHPEPISARRRIGQ